MKPITLSRSGPESWRPIVVASPRGFYFALRAGMPGRGRWEYRLPLAARDFPVPAEPSFASDRCPTCGTLGNIDAWSAGYPTDPTARRGMPCPACATREFRAEVEPRPLGRTDAAGNNLFILVASSRPGYLARVFLDPGYRGTATYTFSGDLILLGEGREAQGAAGRMGSAPIPVFSVTGPAEIRWTRRGRLYGTPSEWIARFDGDNWSVQPAADAAAEAEVFA